MRFRYVWALGFIGWAGAGLGCAGDARDADATDDPNEEAADLIIGDDFGTLRVISTTKDNKRFSTNVDRNNPFFKDLGINGRTCNSCHKLEQALGISVAQIQKTFNQTAGKDPIFRINDGSNAPSGAFANVSTLAARRASFSMLLNHGVIRVGIGVPPGADFKLALSLDPYGFASASELSLFRRPLPSVNVSFNSLTMWDGRESEGRPANRDALINQANDATQGHAQRPTPLDMTTRAAIADFQLHLYSTQETGNGVGSLHVKGCDVSKSEEEPGDCEEARGGPVGLAAVFFQGNDDFPGGFAAGKNDPFPFQADGTPAATHDNVSFTVFEPWESETLGPNPKVNGRRQDAGVTKRRGEIGDGENLFYTKPINITGVAGLNDVTGKAVIKGTCTTCHNNPDAGNHSSPRLFNIGTSSPFPSDNVLAPNLNDFPVYVLSDNATGALVATTDPGLALRTGKIADVGRFKPATLRGLGSRAPYFHNGQAKTLNDVVNFYNKRFNIGFTDDEIRKVVLFLQQT